MQSVKPKEEPLPQHWTFSNFHQKNIKNGVFTVVYGGLIYDGKIPLDDKRVSIKYIYEGPVEDRHWSGIGKQTFANGDTFEGNFTKDKKNGRGIYTSHDGCIQEGYWEDNILQGKFKKLYPDGMVVEENFKDGKKHGLSKGELNGCNIEGKFEDGVLKDYKKVRKIKKEDFKMDMQYLTDLITEKKRIYQEGPFYELILYVTTNSYEGIMKGTLLIDKVFLFEGEWYEDKIIKKGTLYDALSGSYEELCYAFGVRLIPKVNMPKSDVAGSDITTGPAAIIPSAPPKYQVEGAADS